MPAVRLALQGYREDKMKTYRRVTHQMGAWQWGYPRGHRHAIVEYRLGRLADGARVWKSYDEVCSGITAGNIALYQRLYPEAFAHPVGSIHNQRIDS